MESTQELLSQMSRMFQELNEDTAKLMTSFSEEWMKMCDTVAQAILAREEYLRQQVKSNPAQDKELIDWENVDKGTRDGQEEGDEEETDLVDDDNDENEGAEVKEEVEDEASDDEFPAVQNQESHPCQYVLDDFTFAKDQLKPLKHNRPASSNQGDLQRSSKFDNVVLTAVDEKLVGAEESSCRSNLNTVVLMRERCGRLRLDHVDRAQQRGMKLQQLGRTRYRAIRGALVCALKPDGVRNVSRRTASKLHGPEVETEVHPTSRWVRQMDVLAGQISRVTGQVSGVATRVRLEGDIVFRIRKSSRKKEKVVRLDQVSPVPRTLRASSGRTGLRRGQCNDFE